MACFIVPAAEAVVTTVLTKELKSKEKEKSNAEQTNAPAEEWHVPFTQKLKWLNTMLWGGSALLAFEHVWHGEVIPTFPFLTAAGEAATRTEMLQEMATTGVGMAIAVTAAWAVMVALSTLLEKRPAATQETKRQKEAGA